MEIGELRDTRGKYPQWSMENKGKETTEDTGNGDTVPSACVTGSLGKERRAEPILKDIMTDNNFSKLIWILKPQNQEALEPQAGQMSCKLAEKWPIRTWKSAQWLVTGEIKN